MLKFKDDAEAVTATALEGGSGSEIEPIPVEEESPEKTQTITGFKQ